MHQETPPLVVKWILDLLNTKSVNMVSEKEVVNFFLYPLNKNKNTPVK